MCACHGRACGPACAGPTALRRGRADTASSGSSACPCAPAAARCADSRDLWRTAAISCIAVRISRLSGGRSRRTVFGSTTCQNAGPAPARCHGLAPPSAPRPAARSVSSGLSHGPWTSGVPWLRSQKILQHDIVEHGVRQEPLQLAVLIRRGAPQSSALSLWASDTSMPPYMALSL